MFTLTINGELGNVLPSELGQPTSTFGKAWNNFLREVIDAAGAKITDAKIDNAGKTINLPVAVHAGR
jgi:hypothetical protein